MERIGKLSGPQRTAALLELTRAEVAAVLGHDDPKGACLAVAGLVAGGGRCAVMPLCFYAHNGRSS
jgi:hypothetical protein